MKEFNLSFADEVPKLKMNEFSNFLYYFRVTYAIACEFLGEFKELKPEQLLGDTSEIEKKFREYLLNFSQPYARTKYFLGDMGDAELLITRISKDSPIMIWIVGLVTALVMAVIIAGGEVDLRSLKFKLNPLGEGLTKLREAFRTREEKDMRE